MVITLSNGPKAAKLGEGCLFSAFVAVVGNNHQFVITAAPKELQWLMTELNPLAVIVGIIRAIGKQQFKEVILVQAVEEFQIIKVVCEVVPVHHT